ncbi:MAG: hypothetical protein K2I21_08495, partial [Acetatifactor sp.]|nr:hypothetical protein [Acetatifactor sp.]
ATTTATAATNNTAAATMPIFWFFVRFFIITSFLQIHESLHLGNMYFYLFEIIRAIILYILLILDFFVNTVLLLFMPSKESLKRTLFE